MELFECLEQFYEKERARGVWNRVALAGARPSILGPDPQK